jgi:sirohydrochlorin cobaltochelatase
VGHGTNLNENSRKIIEQQVAIIRDSGPGYAQVIDTYMEEPPLINDWHSLTTSPNVVVVPFFIADGLHSFQDIPVLLGMEAEVGAAASQREVFRHNPHSLHGRNLYYSSAIGTEPLMAEVILAQVADFDQKHSPKAQTSAADRSILTWLETQFIDNELTIGQVLIRRHSEGYRITHTADAGRSDLPPTAGPVAAREAAKLDAAGEFRPLKSAPNLRQGWQVSVDNLAELGEALDYLYPAAIGLAKRASEGSLAPTALRSNLSRQTGMYRFTNSIRDDQAETLIARCCDTASKCLRRVTYDLAPGQPFAAEALAKTQPSALAGSVPLLCAEVCPLLVAEARKIAQKNFQEKQQPAPAQ